MSAAAPSLPNGFYWYEDDSHPIPAGLCELVGFSGDLTRVYFVSDDPMRGSPVFLLPQLRGTFRPLPWMQPGAVKVPHKRR